MSKTFIGSNAGCAQQRAGAGELAGEFERKAAWKRPLRALAQAALYGVVALPAITALACSGEAASPGAGQPGSGGSAGVADGGEGGEQSGGDRHGCGVAPTSPAALVCERWVCEEASAPECWSCGAESVEDGIECGPADGGFGVCRGGGCDTVPDPGKAGNQPVTKVEAELKLPEGLFGTTIDLDVYLPAGAGPYPIIVFHHGFQLNGGNYVSYAEHMTSWGYVVVVPSMPGLLTTHVTLNGYLSAVLDWVEENASGTLQGKGDPEKLGLAGHSMGGKISFMRSAEDSRPKAIFGVDPVDAAGGPVPMSPQDYPSITPERMGNIDVPIGVVGETVNGTCTGAMCVPCAPLDDNFQQYYEHAVSPIIEIDFLTANHMSFVDEPCGIACSACPAGTDSPNQTRRLTRRYMTAFFNLFLKNQTDSNVYLTGSAMKSDEATGLLAMRHKNGFPTQASGGPGSGGAGGSGAGGAAGAAGAGGGGESEELVCTAANSLCVTLNVPPSYSGSPKRFFVGLYNSLPPMGPPNESLPEVPSPTVVAGAPYPLEINNVTAQGNYHLYVVLYDDAGGSFLPESGVDYVASTPSTLTFNGGPVNAGSLGLVVAP